MMMSLAQNKPTLCKRRRGKSLQEGETTLVQKGTLTPIFGKYDTLLFSGRKKHGGLPASHQRLLDGKRASLTNILWMKI